VSTLRVAERILSQFAFTKAVPMYYVTIRSVWATLHTARSTKSNEVK